MSWTCAWKKHISKIGAAITMSMVIALPAFAQDTQLDAAKLGAGVGEPSDIRFIIMRIISITLGLIGMILVGLLAYAGWMYMTAGGETDQTEKAKKTIQNAIIGLVIIVLSYAIARFVTDSLIKATET